MFLFGLAYGVATVIFLLVVHHMDITTETAKSYFPFAQSVLEGTIPDIEYPPLALVFITIPGFFASTPEGYSVAFSIMAYLFFLMGLVLAAKFAKRSNQSQYLAMLAYTVMMLLMLEFVLDRYDIFPMIMTMLSLYCFITKRYTWAWVILSIATMTKLYPAVLMPVYLMMFLMDRDWKGAFKGIAVYALVALAVILPVLLLGSDTISYFYGYHMDRPLQLESTAASLIAVLAILGLTTVGVEFTSGSDNLIGAWPDAVAPFLTPLTIVVLLVLYAVAAYVIVRMKRSGLDNENNRMVILGVTLFAAVALFVSVGKVFSAQYMVWLIPLVLFLMMTTLDHFLTRRIFIIFLVAEVLTQVNFAVNFGLYNGEFNEIGMMVLLVRNILMFVLLFLAFKGLRDHLFGARGRTRFQYRKL
jgi:Protein of unknown function (DUF2029).